MIDYEELEEVKEFDKYIKETWEKRKKITSIIDEHDQVTPERINYCLGSYSEINDTLLFECRKELTRLEYYKNEFDHEKEEWFLLARDKINGDRVKSNYASQKEITAQAYHDNKAQWKVSEDKLFFIQAKCTMLMELRDNLKSHSFMLKEMSENLKAELRTLNVDRILAKPETKVVPLPQREQIKQRVLKQNASVVTEKPEDIPVF